MPERIWSYPCCGQTSTATSCPTCGGPGEFDGWGPTVADAIERYRSAYGLEPVGPHLQLAKEVFQGLRTECGRCNGTCFEGDVYQWRHCPECEGGGGVWTGSEDDIRAARHRVIHFHPSAAVPRKDSPWFGVPWEPTSLASRLTPGRAGSAPGAPAAIRQGAVKRARRTEPVPGSRGAPVNLTTDSKRRRLDALRERRRAARRRPKGYSIHGLRHSDVRAAFVEAERVLGVDWPLKGRGHCRRASLGPSYARTVATVARSCEVITPEFRRTSILLFPLAIIEEAARILGVTPWILVGQEY